jgi:hypothetical protein
MKDENVVNGKGKVAKKSQKHIRRNGRARGQDGREGINVRSELFKEQVDMSCVT